MSVTDFECAIAKSQIGRYIAGDNLAPEIARQLESHINNCSRCKQLLQEKKSSLEAIIVDDEETVRIASDAIPMTSGSSALKPDYMEAMADSARKSLREKLKESTRINGESVEIPKVASAFAYKDAEETEMVQLKIETPQEPAQKKNGILSAFALFKDVPQDSTRPAMTMNNIRAAKAVIRNNDQSMKKPTLYLAGLCVVAAAMSFILRDPTTLFGSKVATKGATSSKQVQTTTPKKPVAKVAKLRPHRQVRVNEKGVDAQQFTTKTAPQLKTKVKEKPVIAATKKKPTKVTKVAVPERPIKSAKAATQTITSRIKANPSKVKSQAQRFSDAPKVKTRQKSSSPKKARKSPEPESTVKLYTPESTPQSQEQN